MLSPAWQEERKPVSSLMYKGAYNRVKAGGEDFGQLLYIKIENVDLSVVGQCSVICVGFRDH